MKLHINMYSGMAHLNPEVDISDDDYQIIDKKLKKILNNEIIKKTNFRSLGSDCFSICWPNDNYEDINNKMIYIKPGEITFGYVIDNEYRQDTFADTDDLYSFLSILAKPAIDNHYKEADIAMVLIIENI